MLVKALMMHRMLMVMVFLMLVKFQVVQMLDMQTIIQKQQMMMDHVKYYVAVTLKMVMVYMDLHTVVH